MKTLVAALGALWLNDEPQPNAWGNPTALKIQYFASRRRFKAGSSIPGKQELDQDEQYTMFLLLLGFEEGHMCTILSSCFDEEEEKLSFTLLLYEYMICLRNNVFY